MLQLVENLADAIENGARDQHSDALVCTLNYFASKFLLVNQLNMFDLSFLVSNTCFFVYLLFFSKVTELSNQFEKCQHLLHTISSSINAKAMVIASTLPIVLF